MANPNPSPATRFTASGNPKGRPRAVRELLDRARKSVPAALELAEQLMGDAEVEARVRLEAAKFLTSYGLGAPPKQPHDDDEADERGGAVSPEKALGVLLHLKRDDESTPDPDDG